MKVLIFGCNGQLGTDLLKTMPEDYNLVAFDRNDLDIRSEKNVFSSISRINPDVVINTAAYTSVDQAEIDSVTAFDVNGYAVEYLAKAAISTNSFFIQISTDYVFDGLKNNPYQPDDHLNPQTVYGKSKALGEKLLRNIYSKNYYIIRTSWLYSSHGNNFVQNILRLMKEKNEINVVTDQVGCPTWTYKFSQIIWRMVSSKIKDGIYHWTDSGLCSWYEFAKAIYEEATDINLIDKNILIRPVLTSQYPRPAIRPGYSVLDTSKITSQLGIKREYWRTELKNMLKTMDSPRNA